MAFFEHVLYDESATYIALRIVAILIITVSVARAINKLLLARGGRKLYSKYVDNMIVILVYVVGIFTALGEIPGFEANFSALLTGSGIIALAISLAAQESLGNAINGMVLSMSKPFEVGDRIKLLGGNITGFVEDITLRHTVMRTFMNSRVIIPNSVINKDMVENSSYMDVRASGFVDITVAHDADLAQAELIMAEVAGAHPDFMDSRTEEQQDQPKVPTYVRGVTVYGVDLRCSVWTANIHNNFAACSDVRREIIRRYREAGIAFARCEVAVQANND